MEVAVVVVLVPLVVMQHFLTQDLLLSVVLVVLDFNY
tara:strand:- start:1141 stop:1251 length:111 start_codon:yes stop_codon:yes gene_type:complete